MFSKHPFLCVSASNFGSEILVYGVLWPAVELVMKPSSFPWHISLSIFSAKTVYQASGDLLL